jgi:hypothetical protein
MTIIGRGSNVRGGGVFGLEKREEDETHPIARPFNPSWIVGRRIKRGREIEAAR